MFQDLFWGISILSTYGNIRE